MPGDAAEGARSRRGFLVNVGKGAAWVAGLAVAGVLVETHGDVTSLWRDDPTPIGEPFGAGGDHAWTSVDVSPDLSVFAAAQLGGPVQLWDLRTRRKLGDPLATLEASPIQNYDLALSPDAERLAVCPNDGTVEMWEVASRRRAWTYVPKKVAAATEIVFSADGRTLAAGFQDGTVRLWSPASNAVRTAFSVKAGDDYILSLAASADGSVLAAAASGSNTPQLWNGRAGERLGDLVGGHDAEVDAIAFSPDGSRVATASRDQTVQLWDVASRRPTGITLTGSGAFTAVAFSPDGKTLATRAASRSRSSVRLWNATTGKAISGSLAAPGSVSSAVVFDPTGTTLASLSGDPHETVRLWRL